MILNDAPGVRRTDVFSAQDGANRKNGLRRTIRLVWKCALTQSVGKPSGPHAENHGIVRAQHICPEFLRRFRPEAPDGGF